MTVCMPDVTTLGSHTLASAVDEAITRAGRGDVGALARTYDLLGAVVWCAALDHCADEKAAEEWTVSRFAALWSAAPAYLPGVDAPLTWALSRLLVPDGRPDVSPAAVRTRELTRL